MNHIKTPVQIDPEGTCRFCDLDNDSTDFEALIIKDQDEQICLIPTDLKPNPEEIATEIVQAVNLFDEMADALKAAVRYDDAIRSCANDPNRMSSYCTAAREDLDRLYLDWITKSRRALSKLEAVQ